MEPIKHNFTISIYLEFDGDDILELVRNCLKIICDLVHHPVSVVHAGVNHVLPVGITPNTLDWGPLGGCSRSVFDCLKFDAFRLDDGTVLLDHYVNFDGFIDKIRHSDAS